MESVEYGRRPYPFGRNFGALSSVSPPVLTGFGSLGFLVFSFWTPYFLRGSPLFHCSVG